MYIQVNCSKGCGGFASGVLTAASTNTSDAVRSIAEAFVNHLLECKAAKHSLAADNPYGEGILLSESPAAVRA